MIPLRGRRKQEPPGRRRRSRAQRVVVAVVVVVIIIVALVIFARFYVDWLWFGEVALRDGLLEAHDDRSGARPGLRRPSSSPSSTATSRSPAGWPRSTGPSRASTSSSTCTNGHRGGCGRSALVLSLLVAIVVGFGAAGSWLTFARALNAVPFGAKDPIFHHDLVVLRLHAAGLAVRLQRSSSPRSSSRWSWRSSRTCCSGGIELQQREYARDAGWSPAGSRPCPGGASRRAQVSGVRIESGAVAHVSALLGALFIVAGVGYLLKAWNLLYSTSGAVFGAGYTDVHVRLPLIRVLMVLAFLLGAALDLQRRARPAPALAADRRRRVDRRPDRLLGHRAGRLAGARRQPEPAQPRRRPTSPTTSPPPARPTTSRRSARPPTRCRATSPRPSSRPTAVTVSNIRLWDPEVLLRSYSQLQELRPYYSFTSVSVDRYLVERRLYARRCSPRASCASPACRPRRRPG